jgi:hypothetical protein
MSAKYLSVDLQIWVLSDQAVPPFAMVFSLMLNCP